MQAAALRVKLKEKNGEVKQKSLEAAQLQQTLAEQNKAAQHHAAALKEAERQADKFRSPNSPTLSS